MRQERGFITNRCRSNPRIARFQATPHSFAMRHQFSPCFSQIRVVRDHKKSLKKHCQPVALSSAPIIFFRPRPQLSDTLKAQRQDLPLHVRLVFCSKRIALLFWMKQTGYRGIKQNRAHSIASLSASRCRRSARSVRTYSNKASGSSSAGHNREISSKFSIGETCCCSINPLSKSVSSLCAISCFIMLPPA